MAATHPKNTSSICPLCDKRFESSAALAHMAAHVEDREVRRQIIQMLRTGLSLPHLKSGSLVKVGDIRILVEEAIKGIEDTL